MATPDDADGAANDVTAPEGASRNEAKAWHCAATVDDLWEGEMSAVRIGAAEVLLIHLGGGELRAYDNRCPHAGAPLDEGELRGDVLRCGAHLWEFDARSGEGINPDRCKLRSYPLRVESGAVFVRLPAIDVETGMP